MPLPQFTIMAMVPSDRQTLVKEYIYYMHDEYTGKLYLLDSPIDGKMVSFESAYTGRKTPWHGLWVGDEYSFLVHFDDAGDPRKAVFEWTDVCVDRPEPPSIMIDDNTILEKEPLEKLANKSELNAFAHDGFWQCMDNKRDHEFLEKIYSSGQIPWV